MKSKRFLIILCLFMTLICCINAISAAANDTMDITASEIDSDTETISVENNEQVDVVDQTDSASNTQEKQIDKEKITEENKLGSSNNSAILKDEFTGTSFAQLQTKINELSAGKVLYLTQDITQESDSQITISKAITIDGQGHTIDAKKRSRIFEIGTNGVVTFNNIKFTNGHSEYGGAIFTSAGSLVVGNCTFTNNTAQVYGGAIYTYAGSLVVGNSTFTNNTAKYGGAISSSELCSVVVGNCTFTNNTAQVYGGAIYTDFSSLVVGNSTFTNNTAKYGGAICTKWGSLVVGNSTFTNNTAQYNGGAIFTDADSVLVVGNCTFTNNTAAQYGGAIYTYTGSLVVGNSTFTNNTAPYGGAIYTEVNIVVVDYNWWGSNTPDFNTLVRGASVNNWVMASLTVNGNEAVVRLNLLNHTNGTVTTYDYENSLPARNVTYTLKNGTTRVALTKTPVTIGTTGLTSAKIDNQILTQKDLDNITVDVIPGNTTIVTVTVPEDFTGNVTVNINGTPYPATKVNNTTYKVNATLSPGNYSVNVTVSDDPKYENKTTTTEDFTVKKTLNDDNIIIDVKPGNTTEITITVPEDITGNVTVDINGTEYPATKVNDTTYKADIPLGPGNYSVNVTVSDDPKYADKTTATEEFNVPKVSDYPIDMTITPNYCGVTIDVVVPEDYTGEIKVVVNGTEYPITDLVNGTGSVDIPLDLGNYAAFAISSGDEKYEGRKTDSVPFVVKPIPSEVNITIPSDIKAGEDANITVSIPNATGNVTVVVDGVQTDVPLDENGTAIIPIDNITPGNHSIVVVYPGDGYIEPIIASKSFNVPKSSENTVAITDLVIDKDYVVSAKLVDENGVGIAGAIINYTIDGVANSTFTGADGSFSIAGTQKCVIDIIYEGNSTLPPVNTSVTLNFGRLSTYIKGNTFTQYAIDYYVGERGGYFEVQLFDENGKVLANKPVKIGFNGVVYNTTTNSSGWAKLQINLKSAGKYTFAVGFLGDDDYTGSMEVYLIQVNKKPTSISASAASYKASAKTKKYTVTLSTEPCSSIDGKTYMASGKVMKLVIGGKTYTATTNSKGKATFNIGLTKKGTYSATVKFAGDTSYATSSKTVKITLK